MLWGCHSFFQNNPEVQAIFKKKPAEQPLLFSTKTSAKDSEQKNPDTQNKEKIPVKPLRK